MKKLEAFVDWFIPLLEQYGAQAMWVDGQGTKFYGPGFRALIRT